MSLPNQIAAYDDCFDYFDRAKQSDKGIRIPFENFEAAKQFQLRMHNARALDRQESRRINDRNTPQWDKSEFDRLCVRNPKEVDGRWWVYVEPYSGPVDGVEEL